MTLDPDKPRYPFYARGRSTALIPLLAAIVAAYSARVSLVEHWPAGRWFDEATCDSILTELQALRKE
jgi:hypothetical protein